MGIFTLENLFREAPCPILCEALFETSYESSDPCDCDHERSDKQSASGPHSDHEHSALEGRTRPEDTNELMPPIVHPDFRSELEASNLSTND